MFKLKSKNSERKMQEQRLTMTKQDFRFLLVKKLLFKAFFQLCQILQTAIYSNNPNWLFLVIHKMCALKTPFRVSLEIYTVLASIFVLFISVFKCLLSIFKFSALKESSAVCCLKQWQIRLSSYLFIHSIILICQKF